jgi:serine protease Do
MTCLLLLAAGAAALQPLDRSFVATVVRDATPSLALLQPLGPRNRTSTGTGFAVDCGGETLIVTSAHVANGGTRVDVSLACDGFAAPRRAELVGRSDDVDVAVLRVDGAADLAPLAFADSDAADVGDFVVGLGHAGGILAAASLGILSGRDREFVLTDAALAGGMSGGPLLTAEGEVLGINTLVRPQLGGLGNYAIASNRLRRAVDAILEDARADATAADIALYLYNDPVNRRAAVKTALEAAGVADAEEVMMAAHTTGRGLVRRFEAADEAGAAALEDALRARDLLVERERVLRASG